MGTVPDPVRSAKLLLVAASEEKDGQGDLQSTKHQRKQVNIERSSNGISYTRVEPAGVCLFDLNCTVASDLQRGEQLCGHDTSQPGMFLPESSNQPAEEPLAYTESDNNSEQKGSDHSPVQARTVTRTSATGQAADMMPATYNADPQCMQTDLPRSLAQADCAVTNDTAELQELNCPSPGNTIKGCESSHHSSLANTPQRVHGKKEKVAEVTDPSFSLPGRDFEAIPDLQIRPQVYSEAEIRAANDVNSCPTFKTALAQSNEALLQSGCKGSQPVCTAEMEKTGPVLSQLSRFREAGTMTVLPEGMAQESVNRTWRDAEVQAVASTESKSASTSPGMLAAFLKENPPLEAKEQWHIIYQSDDGVTQSALVDDVASLKKPTWCPGMRTEVYGPAAEMDTVTAQLATLQKPPGEPPETICAVPSGNTTPACPCPQAARNIQGTPADWAEAQAVSLTRDSAGLSQLSPGAAVLLKAKPVYQIMVHTSNQPAACQQAGDGESHPSPSAAIPRASNSFPHQVNDWESKKSPGHGSVHHGTEQAETLCSAAGSSTGSHPVQVQTADEVQIGPVNVKIERHPKKEEELMLLDPVCGVNTGTGAAAAASVKAHMPGTVKTEQGKMPEETSLAMKPSSPSLQAASTPVLNVNSTQDTQRLGTPTASPHQVSKTSETRKKLALGPASAPPLPHLGEKKKKPMVATEAKVQVQPSKHVRDVVWDEQGMTWEVYGASLDPESLGIAIQNHLQRQIREHEKLIRAQSTQNRKSVSSDTSSNKKLKGRQHNVFQSMLQNLRRPNCCVRPAPSSVLD